MFYLATVVVALAVLFYWRPRRRVVTDGRTTIAPSPVMILLALGMISLVILMDAAERWSDMSRAGERQIALAIAFDTSLSMFTGPDPTRFPEVNNRLDRSKQVILDVLKDLDDNQRNVLVSLVVFTVRAANVLGWNPNLREVGTVIDRALTTNLIGRGGTDLGGALARCVEVFDTLPERSRLGARKVLLFVSDGERTVDMVAVEENLQALQRRGVTVISLQVGLLDEPEGVREYDEFGFTGFWKGAGSTYSVPDTDAMVSLAGNGGGLYVRVEDPAASRLIIQHLQPRNGFLTYAIEPRELLMLGLWLLSVVTLVRLLA